MRREGKGRAGQGKWAAGSVKEQSSYREQKKQQARKKKKDKQLEGESKNI